MAMHFSNAWPSYNNAFYRQTFMRISFLEMSNRFPLNVKSNVVHPLTPQQWRITLIAVAVIAALTLCAMLVRYGMKSRKAIVATNKDKIFQAVVHVDHSPQTHLPKFAEVPLFIAKTEVEIPRENAMLLMQEVLREDAHKAEMPSKKDEEKSTSHKPPRPEDEGLMPSLPAIEPVSCVDNQTKAARDEIKVDDCLAITKSLDDQALTVFENFLQSHPHDVFMLGKYAEVLYQLKRIQDAAVQTKIRLTIESDVNLAFYLKLLCELGQFDEADAQCDSYLSRYPKDFVLLRDYANELSFQNEHRRATDRCRQALAIELQS